MRELFSHWHRYAYSTVRGTDPHSYVCPTDIIFGWSKNDPAIRDLGWLVDGMLLNHLPTVSQIVVDGPIICSIWASLLDLNQAWILTDHFATWDLFLYLPSILSFPPLWDPMPLFGSTYGINPSTGIKPGLDSYQIGFPTTMDTRDLLVHQTTTITTS